MKGKLLIPALIIGFVLISIPMLSKISDILKKYFPSWEGFSSTPYWDFKQWSWGYGTKVPGSVADRTKVPTGTITREKAMSDAMKHIQADYNYLKPLVKVNLNTNQWAAFLSFSYNLGSANADNLIPNINAQNWSALEIQWKKYIYAGGEINSHLVNRRNDEWRLFTS